MKKIIIAAGVVGVLYYFLVYNRPAAPAVAANPAVGTLNNPTAGRTSLGRINLGGTGFATRVPGVASVS